jgi:MoxR-like ATPase
VQQLVGSTRAHQSLCSAAQAWALIDGRNAVLPDDVQAVWPAVALHRLEPRNAADRSAAHRDQLLRTILESVSVPR